MSMMQIFPRAVWPCPRHRAASRFFSTSPNARQASEDVSRPNPRWLPDLQRRVEALRIRAGAGDAEVLERISGDLQRRWLDLSAGREGFLTGERWRGLDRVPVAWGDMDSMGHVNNIVYNRYAESGRVNWVTSFAAHAPPGERQQWLDVMSPRGFGLILKSIKTDFKLPVTYPDKITVIHKLSQRPESSSTSIHLDAVIYSERHRRVAARCLEDIALYDYRASKLSVMKPFMADTLRAVWNLQEQERREVEREIGEMDRLVEMMEKGGS